MNGTRPRRKAAAIAPRAPGARVRVLGIDPGTLRMGYGLLDAEGETLRYVACGVLTAPAHAPTEQRLTTIHSALQGVLKAWRPDSVAIEEPFLPRSDDGFGFRTSAKSAIAVGQAQAIALLAATQASLPVFRYTPAQVKRTVSDYGGGSKEQVQEMTRLLLGLAQRPEPADAADALAVAICHAQRMQSDRLLREALA